MLKRLLTAHRGDPGYDHRVISLRGLGALGEELRGLGVQVECMGLKSLANAPLALWRLVRRIRAIDPDIVQTWMYHSDLIGGLSARLAGKRNLLWGVRVADLSPDMGVPRSTILIRRLCARLSGIVPARIVYVAEAARLVHERLGYAGGKSVVIQNGYDIPPTATVEALRGRRQSLGLTPDCVLIGTAGRYSPQKGYQGFVGAAGRVAARHPDAHFLIIGRGVGWENEELAGWVRETGAADRFHLLPEQQDVREWLAAMDIFALNSLMEGFPNIVAEAMSVGVPCIVTDVGDAALLVDDTGIVIEPRDEEGLTQAMLRLVSEGKPERSRLGALARERVSRKFSIESIVGRYEELFDGFAPARTERASSSAA